MGKKLKMYSGGFSYDAFKTFVEKKLGPSCDPEHKNLCSPAEKSLMQSFQVMTLDELTTKIDDIESDWQGMQDNWKTFVEDINSRRTKGGEKAEDLDREYKEETEKMNKAHKNYKATNIELMKAVQENMEGESDYNVRTDL